MTDRSTRVCPVEKAGSLDTRIRRWFQNPRRILSPYIREGMTVIDLGCGPGFFTMDMALLAGRSGRVIAADLQEGMLEKVREKISGTEIEERITLHKCRQESIGLDEKVDFLLAFYLIHEVPEKDRLFREISSLLRPGGTILIVEPPMHVSEAAFKMTLESAEKAGLRLIRRPKMLLQKTAVMEKT
ncbi:MAG: class I SAM-dependent methyltransferase [Candidatus Krumholzibacteriota bacterium]|nr:class I SAM-dependent methyltransferase [Candidatus Krumholzibacteriota bacterium]